MHASSCIAKVSTRTLVVALLATLAIGLAAMSAASPASAATGTLYAGKSDGPPHAGMCAVQASAYAEKVAGYPFPSGHIHTDVHIGPNSYWFVGCRWKVSVDLVSYQYGVLQHVEHVATAGALFDPW